MYNKPLFLSVSGAALLLAACSLVNQADEVESAAPGGEGGTGTGATGGTGGTGGTGTGTGTGAGGAGGAGGSDPCSDSLVYCDDTCIDPQIDPEYCGASDDCQGSSAGTVCDVQTEECVDGACACLPALTDCGTCIDPQIDPEYCGASGDCQGPNAGTVCDVLTEECANGVCVCLPNLVDCGGCIDPQTDPEYCGASGDCQGTNIGVACPPTAACDQGACDDTCINCSFESGDFSGWITSDLADPFWALAVVVAGTNIPNFTTTPTDGTYSAANGYDGGGPGNIEIGQDLTLANVASATLEFDYRLAWDLFGGASRTFSVQIEPAGGGPPLQTDLIMTSTPGSFDTGIVAGSVDMSSFVGQTVFVRFVWWIPELYTGPGSAEIDNIRVTAP